MSLADQAGLRTTAVCSVSAAVAVGVTTGWSFIGLTVIATVSVSVFAPPVPVLPLSLVRTVSVSAPL